MPGFGLHLARRLLCARIAAERDRSAWVLAVSSRNVPIRRGNSCYLRNAPFSISATWPPDGRLARCSMNTLPESGSGRDTIDTLRTVIKLSGATGHTCSASLNLGQAVFRFLDHYFDSLDRRFVRQFSNRTPRRSSSCRIVWLWARGATPRRDGRRPEAGIVGDGNGVERNSGMWR